jgi:hypothetical protein
VARSLQILIPDQGTPSIEIDKDVAISHLKIVLKLNSGIRDYQRELESIYAHSDESGGCVLEHFSEQKLLKSIPFNLTDDDSDICHLAMRAICLAIFGDNNLPPYPEVFNPPVHLSDKIQFVRMSEIPEPARTAFSECLNGSTVPAIPGEHRDNVAFAWDWNRFSGN